MGKNSKAMAQNTLMTPLVSVIIPVLNEENYILRSLNSLSEQSCDPQIFEVIIVDNNSTDKTMAVIVRFKKNHPNIKIKVTSEKKQGIDFARKTGMDLGKNSKYLCTIDAESKVSINFIDEIIKTLKNKNVDALTWKFIIDWKSLLLISKEVRSVNNIIIKKSKNLKHVLKKYIGTNLQGSGYAIKQKIYKKIGGIKVNYAGPLLYADDMLLSQRVRFLGGNIILSNNVIELSGRRLFVEPEAYLTGESHWGNKKLNFYPIYETKIISLPSTKKLLKRKYLVGVQILLRFLIDSIIFSKKNPSNQVSKKQINLIRKFLELDKYTIKQINKTNWHKMLKLISDHKLDKIATRLLHEK